MKHGMNGQGFKYHTDMLSQTLWTGVGSMIPTEVVRGKESGHYFVYLGKRGTGWKGFSIQPVDSMALLMWAIGNGMNLYN